jgi:hypothetical protein
MRRHVGLVDHLLDCRLHLATVRRADSGRLRGRAAARGNTETMMARNENEGQTRCENLERWQTDL